MNLYNKHYKQNTKRYHFMFDLKSRLNLRIGMRNIKTAISATLCVLIYLLFDRNPTFACIGAIFGMGSDMENSISSGGNRLAGTILGGALGMSLFPIYTYFHPDGGLHYLLLLFMFVGSLLLVLVCLFFKSPGAIQPGGVVLCIILFNTPVDSFVSYSLNRIFDTAFGVTLSVLINYFFPRERIVKILTKLGIPTSDDNK